MRLEIALFVAMAHLLALLCWAHVSFVAREGASDCLAAYLEPNTAPALLRVQIQSEDPFAHTPAFVYAAEKQALVALSELREIPETSPLANVSTLILPASSRCFDLLGIGQPELWTIVLDLVLGYDTIVQNLLLQHYGPRGFCYRESTKRIYDLQSGVFRPNGPSAGVSNGC